MQQQPNAPNLFLDTIICGAIGGGCAWLFDRPFFLWTILCGIVGPLFILFASRFVETLPPTLPGRQSGAYEFIAFALFAAILVAVDPFAR